MRHVPNGCFAVWICNRRPAVRGRSATFGWGALTGRLAALAQWLLTGPLQPVANGYGGDAHCIENYGNVATT